MAAFTAATLVYQKLINKKDATPIPSHEISYIKKDPFHYSRPDNKQLNLFT